MTTNGQPTITTDWMRDRPLCLVCEEPLSKGQKVVVSVPEMVFIHLGCVDGQKEAEEIFDRYKKSGGE